MMLVVVMGLNFSACASKKEADKYKIIDKVGNELLEVPILEGWEHKNVQSAFAEDSLTLFKGDRISITCMISDSDNLGDMDANEYMNVIKNNLDDQTKYGITTKTIESKQFAYGEVVYVEMDTKVNELFVTDKIAAGVLNQETLEQVGGMQQYLEIMQYAQMGVYILHGDKLVILTGQVAQGDLSEIYDEVMYVFEHINFKK